LEEYLNGNCESVLRDVAKYGAVLLRGFPVATVMQFEHLISSIPAMHSISDFLMPEPGRNLVEGTKFVFYTSTVFKTGGTLDFGVFHTENYYVPDVPRYICFYCVRPSRFGGETGLLNTARLYKELPEDLKCKLEKQAFWVATTSMSEVAERYACSELLVQHFCAEQKLHLKTSPDGKDIIFYKPAVIVHPATGELCLCIHFAGELDRHGLRQSLIKEFRDDYSGLRWVVHRFYWRYEVFARLKGIALGIAIPLRLAVPWSVIFRFLLDGVRRVGSAPHKFAGTRAGEVFSAQDMKLVAALMRRNYTSFCWKTGDVLIVDNLKMAHAGMPGCGSRDLKAIICNPVLIPCVPGPGVLSVPSATSETLDSKLRSSIR
jgi:alpha-ketoglutarate-dependent taurine dioxygenase